VIRQKYTYTQAENFRLTALQSGVSPNFNNLQNITYSYDDQGNVLTVVDAAAFGGSQTQTFTYDALNRLLTAQASGGSYGTYTPSAATSTPTPATSIPSRASRCTIWMEPTSMP
jgi:YD repeat-containing protein